MAGQDSQILLFDHPEFSVISRNDQTTVQTIFKQMSHFIKT